MSGIRIHHVSMLYMLWLVPVMLALFVYASQRRRKALRLFADEGLLGQLGISASKTRRRWKASGIITAFVLLIIASARPAWNPKPKTIRREGRDVVFLLDVSKSMLAQDLVPNRMDRAKLAISDCVAQLQGDRVALVAFAGTAAVKCPLTLDYGFFRMMLDNISPDSIARGGTMIGDALRKTLTDVFDDQQKKYKDIILITDGEDHDSFPVKAAEKVGEENIRLIAIGLGDENEGTRIPITDRKGKKQFLKYEGKEVWTRLDGDSLRKMVNATPGGKYFNVATNTIDLGQVYLDLIVGAEKKQLESRTVERHEDKFQVFLSLAFAILCIEAVSGDRGKPGQRSKT